MRSHSVGLGRYVRQRPEVYINIKAVLTASPRRATRPDAYDPNGLTV